MIEDSEKTLAILEYFAQDKIDNPSNITGDNLVTHFSEWRKNVVFYHIRCAKENGWLIANIQKPSFTGDIYKIGGIDGLTAAGGAYVKKCRLN